MEGSCLLLYTCLLEIPELQIGDRICHRCAGNLAASLPCAVLEIRSLLHIRICFVLGTAKVVCGVLILLTLRCGKEGTGTCILL